MNDWIAKRPWFPYVAPMALYMVFLQAQVSWPQLIEFWYPAKAVAVAATLWWLRCNYVELDCPFRCSGASMKRRSLSETELPAARKAAATIWLESIAIGLLTIVIWIGIDPFYPKIGGDAAPFDPTGKWWFISFRVAGAVLVVPVMEELFWRAFLIRWLANEDFKSVPLGTFTWFSFASTVFLFGVEHSQWLAGLICGALYNWLFYRTRSVFACVIAHAVSNAALAAWVLGTGDWKFW